MAAPLRAVGPDDQAPKQRKMTVAEAAASGNQLATLEAMRDRIALAVTDPKCPPRDLASLTKRLDDITEKIAAIRARATEEDGEDADSDEDEAWDAEAL